MLNHRNHWWKTSIALLLTALVIILLQGCSIKIVAPLLTEDEIYQLNNPSSELLVQVESYIEPALEFVAMAELNGKNEGRALSINEATFAKDIGIDDVDSIRIVVSSNFPSPENLDLISKFNGYGLNSWFNKGITFGNTIYLKPRVRNNSTIIKHELVHVRQYALLGKREFLKQLLIAAEVLDHWNSMPFEVEAYTLQESPIKTD